MKKIIMLIFTMLLCLNCCITCYANEGLVDNDNSEIANRKEYIAEYTNQFYKGQISKTITAKDVDINRALKVYINVDLFEDTKLSKSMAINILDAANYVYYLPVDVNNKTVYYTLSKSKNVSNRARAVLTNEEIEKLENEKGQWVVSEITEYPAIVDYKKELYKTINNSYIDFEDIAVIGGLRKNISALCIGEEDAVFLMFDENLSDNSCIELTPTFYSFSEIKEDIEKNVLKEGEIGGYKWDTKTVNKSKYENNIFLVLIITGTSVALITILVFSKKSRRKHYEKHT